MKRVDEKIKEISNWMEELGEIAPSNFEEYGSNKEKKAACERYVEKIIEAVTDVAFLVIKERRWRMPNDDNDAFIVLKENKLISEDLANKLKGAKGMRNILAHQYGEVNDQIVFEAITENLEDDVNDFIKSIKKKKDNTQHKD